MNVLVICILAVTNHFHCLPNTAAFNSKYSLLWQQYYSPQNNIYENNIVKEPFMSQVEDYRCATVM